MIQAFTKWLAAALILVVVGACSRTDNNAAPTGSSLKEGARSNHDASSLYDPSTLVEVHSFDDLPESIKKLANDSYMKTATDNQYPRFLAGGASKSSAVVAIELFGYVPTVFAQAYIHNEAGWVAAKTWNNIGPVNNLQGLLAATNDVH